MPDTVTLVVNGEERSLEVEGRTLLVHALRDGLGLTGAHIGCDTSQCGACTVLLDGRAVKSCTVLAHQAEGREITTIEGLAPDGELHPLQRAFVEHHGLQCGFCTPGVILTAADLLSRGRVAERRGDPARAARQPLPLHRLPGHRRVDPRRRGRVVIPAADALRARLRPRPRARAPRRAGREGDRRRAVAHPGDEAAHRAAVARRRHLAARPARRRRSATASCTSGRSRRGTSSSEPSSSQRPALAALAECARGIGDLQVRNLGTIGGSVVHADPASDMPAVLLALGARLRLRSPDGERELAVADALVGPFTTALGPQELVTDIVIPVPARGSGSAYASRGASRVGLRARGCGGARDAGRRDRGAHRGRRDSVRAARRAWRTRRSSATASPRPSTGASSPRVVAERALSAARERAKADR